MYKMTVLSRTKYCFEQFLSDIYAVSFCKTSQQVCINCFKPRSKKNKFE